MSSFHTCVGPRSGRGGGKSAPTPRARPVRSAQRKALTAGPPYKYVRMDEERGVDKDLEDRDGDKDVSTDRNIDFVNLVRKAIFTMLAVFLYICFVRALVARGRSAPADSLNPYADRRLTFGSDGRFRLALFSDLHYGERYADNSWAAWAEEADRKSTIVMDTILTVEKPDFVVFGGDQITGENTLWENSTAYLDQVHAAVLKHNTPFASIYGNHDESYNISHLASYAFEKERAAARALSWTQSNRESAGDPKGIFNYYIPVYASASAKTPALLLWFFDSRAGQFNSRYFGVKDEPWMSQDWVDPGVEPWVRDTVAGMRKQWGSVPRSLAFVHIPPRVVRNIADRVTAEPDTHPGINFEAPSIQGYRANLWKSPDPDAPFWRALTEQIGADGGLLALNSGHDHGDAWCARDDGVGPFSFCYARHTGYGGYGTWTRGARVFEAHLRGDALDKVQTWIRRGKTVLLNTRDPAPE